MVHNNVQFTIFKYTEVYAERNSTIQEFSAKKLPTLIICIY